MSEKASSFGMAWERGILSARNDHEDEADDDIGVHLYHKDEINSKIFSHLASGSSIECCHFSAISGSAISGN
jgi:hypothetical protein